MSGATKLRDLQAGSSGGMMDSTAMETEEYYNQEGGEWSQKVDTGQLCRVCANPNEYLIPIFDGEGLEHELAMKIQKHLPIKVTETDTLPIHICYQCASTLIAWHDLVISCVEADKKLKELQVEDEDDDDDKGAEMFESHSMDSDPADEVDQPSTSEAQSQVTKAPVIKKVTPSKEKKPKLKMVLVKGPPAGTSGQKAGAKSQLVKALEQGKSKEGSNEDSTSERCRQSSLSTLTPVQELKSDIIVKREASSPSNSVWVKSEEDGVSSEICEFCSLSFSTKIELDTHVAKSHANQKMFRIRCEKLFKNKDFYLSHTEVHKNMTSKVSSNRSGPSDVNKVNMSRSVHVKPLKKLQSDPLPQNEASFACHECGKRFKKLNVLSKHIKLHDTIKDETSQNVLDMGVTSDREQIEESDSETNCASIDKVKKMYPCEYCGKNFTLKDSYESHLRTHTGEKPFTCHICGKQFSHTGGLYYHLKHVHAGIKNQSCDICGRSFALKAAMEDHRRIHTGERPYVCHTCGKSFKSKASLYIHSKIHTDSFPHPCTYCERRFRWRQQLLAHLTKHTGEKPHKCEICGKGFGVKNDLTRHKLIHSGEKPFACCICGLSFGQKRYLKNHEKSRHGIQR